MKSNTRIRYRFTIVNKKKLRFHPLLPFARLEWLEGYEGGYTEIIHEVVRYPELTSVMMCRTYDHALQNCTDMNREWLKHHRSPQFSHKPEDRSKYRKWSDYI